MSHADEPYITERLRAYATAQRQAAGASNAGELFDHAAEVIDSRDAEIHRLRNWEPRAGEMHPVDKAFYDLTVKERNYERVKVERLEAEIAALRLAVREYLNGAPLDEQGRFKDPSREVLYRAAGMPSA
jgi:hypothetical protein